MRTCAWQRVMVTVEMENLGYIDPTGDVHQTLVSVRPISARGGNEGVGDTFV